jgi:hypothetical protein
MRSIVSDGIGDAFLDRDRRRQNRRKPARCQRRTVSGWTTTGDAALVESDKVATIQGEHNPTGARREVEDFVIGDRLPRVARFLRREHVVAERIQRFHRSTRKVSFA